VVTLVGWVILLRGLVMVFVSPNGAATLYEALQFADLYYIYLATPFLLGLYLTYAGFVARRN